MRAVLNQIEPGIAVVTNRLGDLLAYTSGFERLARPLGLLDAAAPNLTRFVFTDERARDAFPDWDRIADRARPGGVACAEDRRGRGLRGRARRHRRRGVHPPPRDATSCPPRDRSGGSIPSPVSCAWSARSWTCRPARVSSCW